MGNEFDFTRPTGRNFKQPKGGQRGQSQDRTRGSVGRGPRGWQKQSRPVAREPVQNALGRAS